MGCLAETCAYWTGDGCACQLLDIEPRDMGAADPEEW